ncbi:unnamed protein product [Adineta ricciae]|uniref:F-box domain-containing protein n=1 Tax=Adineta ricciae TaxID=249248 RepID=A0A815MVA2_ADIRI|nr:unnamed protein product [Adineta ricciae]CAF1467134.1 unnamed protein product [Adineta ricciae]
MQQIKRRQLDCFNKYDERKRRKSKSNEIISILENLANETIYEIFEYLDYYHIYQSFYNLNTRFRSLLTKSTLPLKINLFLMSQTTFNRYNQDIIIPNNHRIETLRIENHIIFDEYTLGLSNKIFLRTLIIENIESTCLKNLLDQLNMMLHLSSLSITTLDAIENKNPIYQQIFRLESLKYCKLSLGGGYSTKELPMVTDEYSPIEYLIIDHEIYIEQLPTFFSYVPHLRHLSLHLLREQGTIENRSFSSALNYLTHVSIILETSINFNTLENLLSRSFPFIQVLHISAGWKHFDAHKWQHLISTYLPNLPIFDAVFKIIPYITVQKLEIEQRMNLFRSSFWIDRQWLFDCRLTHTKYFQPIILFSSDPYRRKECIISNRSTSVLCVDKYEKVFKSVHHLQITNTAVLEESNDYFPNVNKLTIEDDSPVFTHQPTHISLNRILPLQQLQILVIEYSHLSFLKIIEFLSYTPNVHTLTFQTMLLLKENKKTIKQNEIFQSISKINRVTNIKYASECTKDELELLIMLFPRLQRLQIGTVKTDMESILRFLLIDNNRYTLHLRVLCFTSVSEAHVNYLKDLINTKAISSNSRIKQSGNNLYLWW